MALPSDEVLAAFNLVEDTYGREWTEQTRTSPRGDPSFGLRVTLAIVSMGQLLKTLRGLGGCDRLLNGLRNGERAARTEVLAIHLTRSKDPSVAVELEPTGDG